MFTFVVTQLEKLVYSYRTVSTLSLVKIWHLLTAYSYITSL